jgi:hypothetical protein
MIPDANLQPHAQRSQTCQITPLVAPYLTQALPQVLGVVLERRLHLTFRMVLQLDLPVVAEEPAGDKVVVVCVEKVVATPCFMREGIGEVGVLQDLRTVGHCSPRQTGQSAIYPVACCAVKVSPY